ncbi:hypothetical protein WJX79_001021 [Trebouxia sp. C0005]
MCHATCTNLPKSDSRHVRRGCLTDEQGGWLTKAGKKGRQSRRLRFGLRKDFKSSPEFGLSRPHKAVAQVS